MGFQLAFVLTFFYGICQIEVSSFSPTKFSQRWRITTELSMSTVESTPVTSASTGATVLRCEGLTKSYTGVPQFEDIKLVLGKGQRVGLIGVNGAGKVILQGYFDIHNAP